MRGLFLIINFKTLFYLQNSSQQFIIDLKEVTAIASVDFQELFLLINLKGYHLFNHLIYHLIHHV